MPPVAIETASTFTPVADNPGDIEPRPLSRNEVSALEFVLSIDDPRILPLRQQVGAARVVWECTCGCATVNFEIDRSRSTPASGLCSPVSEAYRRVPFDSDDACSLLLFLDDGWLSSLELVWYAEPIREFPAPAEFDTPALLCRHRHGAPKAAR